MSRRIVNYDFSEDDKFLIVSRLLGEHFSKCECDEDGRYCGYVGDNLCEIKFFASCIAAVFVREKGKHIRRKEWVNILFRKLFQDDSLDFEKCDKKDFNRYAYAEVNYDNQSVDFIFRYKPMEGAV